MSIGCRASSKTPSAKCPDKIRVCGLAAATAVPWMPPQWQESFSQRCLSRHLHSEVSPIGSAVLPMDTIYWATVHRKHQELGCLIRASGKSNIGTRQIETPRAHPRVRAVSVVLDTHMSIANSVPVRRPVKVRKCAGSWFFRPLDVLLFRPGLLPTVARCLMRKCCGFIHAWPLTVSYISPFGYPAISSFQKRIVG